ncbi:MAG: MMPL family transporter [Pseudomonadota bacterium]
MLGALLALAGYYATGFSFDASSDTLVVRGDPDLATYLRVAETFGGDEFLLLTFTPDEGEALSRDNLDTLAALESDLAEVEGVSDVFSVLDAPLLQSPPVPLGELADGYRTLASPGVDLALAERELTRSPMFRNLLITEDGATTALRIDLALDSELAQVDRERAALRARQRELQGRDQALPPAERARLSELEEAHERLRDHYVTRRDAVIDSVRGIRDRYQSFGDLRLGGVPMIAADMVAFVKSDLVLFGTTVLVLMMVVLYGFFRRVRWVVLPLVTSALTLLVTVGLLGAIDKPATVVSSNFISLLAIITISLTIHLIVRYRELLVREPGLSGRELVRETVRSKFAPCLYNALTTMAAFGSLMVSRIVPVEDFGLMMVLGIAAGFVATFSFFPAVLMLLGVAHPSHTASRELALTRVMGEWARWRYAGVTVAGLACAGAAAYGITQVSLDNRFLEYFQADSEIHQGLEFIDRRLGGTVPLDVVLQFEPYEPVSQEDDFFAMGQDETFPERYWFTRTKLDRVLAMHRYLEQRPELGKVLSVSSLDLVSRQLTDGQPLSSAEIAGVLGALPENLRDDVIAPYADPSSGQLRLNARIIESGAAFDRAELVRDIRTFAVAELGFEPDEVEVTGMAVMFDNMLKQLYDSQIDTLGYVLLAAAVMFLVLLRSVRFAVLGVVPNVIAAASVIAVMGYTGIPLDVMTITIAAISVGIGVDNAIHYLHRYSQERRHGKDVRLAVAWSHATVGRAMYFTTVTVAVGFSVLVLSNFVPTVHFGVLTAAAMVLALVANLLLLPSLLVLFLGPRRARALSR